MIITHCKVGTIVPVCKSYTNIKQAKVDLDANRILPFSVHLTGSQNLSRIYGQG